MMKIAVTASCGSLGSEIEAIDSYLAQGAIANCAGEGRCGYTTRPELAVADAHVLTEAKHNGQTYNLHGETLPQQQLTAFMER